MRIVIATHIDSDGDPAVGLELNVSSGSEIAMAMGALGLGIAGKCGIKPTQVAEMFAGIMRQAEIEGLEPMPLDSPPTGFGDKPGDSESSAANLAEPLAASVKQPKTNNN